MAAQEAGRSDLDERLVVPLSFGIEKTLALWLASGTVIFLGIGREVGALRAQIPSSGFGWEIFDLDAEVNLPALYSAALILLNAGLLLLLHRAARESGDRTARHWLALAIGFVVLALDEALQLHELIGWAIQNSFAVSGYFALGWVIPAVPLLVLIGLAFLPFLARLPRRTMLLFLAAGCLYIAAAVGIEMVQGEILETADRASLPYLVAMLIEESLEIIAMTLFATALLGHLRAIGVDVRLQFS
jgi:hypothetical protein